MKTSAVTQTLLLATALGASALVQADTLPTEFSLEAGVSAYKYEEPGLMQLKGVKASIGARFAKGFGQDKQWALEGRFVNGPVDYESNGTGSVDDEPDYFMDLRGLVSKRSAASFGSFDLYTGLGYRHLVNDGAGLYTTTGHYAYKRVNQMAYLPLGITLHTNNKKLETNVELDFLIKGMQDSYLRNETLHNRQNQGFGFRVSMMYAVGHWSIGPFMNHWNINDSEKISCDGGTSICWEPKNTTTEYGIKTRFQF